MADHPVERLGGKTLLQYAHTPYMDLLARQGRTGMLQTIPEGFDTVSEAIRQALADGARVVLTAGGTGLKPRNRTPEAALEFIDTRLEGLERHILVQGLQSTNLAGLSRGYVGLTSRNADAALIINAPSSVGGITDVLDVICPLLDNVWESLAR